MSPPERVDPHLELLTVAATLTVIVEEIDGVSSRLVSEDGILIL